MSPTPALDQTSDERSYWTINLPDDLFMAGEASPGPVSQRQYEANQYPYTFHGSSMLLVEDARAVLNGDADHLLGNNELLAAVDGTHGIDQGIADAVVLYVPEISFTPLANGPNMTAYANLPLLQVQPRVLAAPAVPPVINQVPHVAVTSPLQCHHGCTGTFRRREEYRRHMKKHTGPFFPCTHPNCGKMFYRQDKLRDHLAKGH